jgi:hypothetical protein
MIGFFLMLMGIELIIHMSVINFAMTFIKFLCFEGNNLNSNQI